MNIWNPMLRQGRSFVSSTEDAVRALLGLLVNAEVRIEIELEMYVLVNACVYEPV